MKKFTPTPERHGCKPGKRLNHPKGKLPQSHGRKPVVWGFTQKVLKIVAKIPKGQTLSYRDVARLAGNKMAYRAVGNILRKNFDPKIPCHRVIRSDKSIGGYNRGADVKAKLLKKEKVILI